MNNTSLQDQRKKRAGVVDRIVSRFSAAPPQRIRASQRRWGKINKMLYRWDRPEFDRVAALLKARGEEMVFVVRQS